MKRLLIVAMILAATATPSFGYYLDGNELYQKCSVNPSSSTEYMDSSYCLAYILGVSDTLDTARANNKIDVCVPAGVQAQQLKDVVLAYLRSRPSIRNLEANILVVNALGDAWGCAAKR